MTWRPKVAGPAVIGPEATATWQQSHRGKADHGVVQRVRHDRLGLNGDGERVLAIFRPSRSDVWRCGALSL